MMYAVHYDVPKYINTDSKTEPHKCSV